jgi:type IV secretion system protein VirB4
MNTVSPALDPKHKPLADQLPFEQQIDPQTVITREGDLTSTLRIDGVPFDAADHSVLDGLNEQWLTLLSSQFRSQNLSLWTHIVRQAVRVNPVTDDYDNPFSQQFAREYAEKYGNAPQFENQLYLSPVYRLNASALDRAAARMSRRDPVAIKERHLAAKEELRSAISQLGTALRKYHPVPLTDDDNGQSALASFYARLINGFPVAIRPGRMDLSQNICQSLVHFDSETITLMGPAQTTYAAVLTLQAPYARENTNCKILQALLSAPFEFVLSQSAVPMAMDEADKLLHAQQNRIASTTGNKTILQDLADARTALGAGKLSMVTHDFLLVVYADSLKRLNANVNAAVEIMNNEKLPLQRAYKGILLPAYFGIMPGSFKHGRIFAKPITSRNFGHFFPLHNYPLGETGGSQWGAPIAVLKTTSNSPYFFNFHISKRKLEEQGYFDAAEADEEAGEDEPATELAATRRSSHKALGNTRIIGASGSGKTAFVMAMRVLARKKQVHPHKPLRTFSFDFGYGEAIGILAMGGEYFTIAAGKPVGINLFTLPKGEETYSLVHSIATWAAQFGGRYNLTMKDDMALNNAIKQVFEELDPTQQRFARILDMLPNDSESSLSQALQPWVGDGPKAWILDSPHDRFDFSKANDFGFDMSNLLDIPEAKTPITRILHHKIKLYAAGTPHLIHMAEAWKTIDDNLMIEYIRERAKAIRKEDGIICLDTQDVADLTSSKFSSTLMRQFPTLVLAPNAEATDEDYGKGLRLSPRELSLVRTTPEGQGYYLIKKGTEMSVTRMDMTGMNNMLAVISTNLDNFALVNELRSTLGPDPAVWLPEFYKRRH